MAANRNSSMSSMSNNMINLKNIKSKGADFPYRNHSKGQSINDSVLSEQAEGNK